MLATATSPVNNFVDRIGDIYSLPAVAMELIELLDQHELDQPGLDASQIKSCIERDPALTAKLLKVVNSSVFGLSGRVANLKQAVALLGMRPLKLLVLGFSLPKQLESTLTREALTEHWRVGITRAIAARRIAAQFLEANEDDAFVAALLADLGKLVLLGEVGESFAALIARSREQQIDLAEQTRMAVGFDHFELTTALLQKWNLPALLPQTVASLAARFTCELHEFAQRDLIRAVVLADLIAEVIECHSLSALPRLSQLSSAWLGLDIPKLKQLMSITDAERRDLAGVFNVELPSAEESNRLLSDAYDRLSTVVEETPIAPPKCVDPWAIEALKSARMAVAVASSSSITTSRDETSNIGVAYAATREDASQRLLRSVTKSILRCRGNRLPLSLLLVEGQSPLTFNTVAEIPMLLAESVGELSVESSTVIVDPATIAVLLPGYDRLEAKRLADRLVAKQSAGDYEVGQIETLNVGVAGVELISRGFDPNRLIQGAARCLVAARHSEGHAVKSIEVY